MKTKFRFCLFLALFAFVISTSAEEKKAAKPIKALLFVGEGYHDYEKLAPHLTNRIGQLVPIHFDVKTNLDALKNKNFADDYDVVVYDICYDGSAGNRVECHARRKTRRDDSLRRSRIPKFRKDRRLGKFLWNAFQSSRSVSILRGRKLDSKHPATKDFPDGWKTPGDELYQTIEFLPASKPLLKVKSPHDGREHIG